MSASTSLVIRPHTLCHGTIIFFLIAVASSLGLRATMNSYIVVSFSDTLHTPTLAVVAAVRSRLPRDCYLCAYVPPWGNNDGLK